MSVCEHKRKLCTQPDCEAHLVCRVQLFDHTKETPVLTSFLCDEQIHDDIQLGFTLAHQKQSALQLHLKHIFTRNTFSGTGPTKEREVT